MDTASLKIAINTGDVKTANAELDKLTNTSKKTEKATDGVKSSFISLNKIIAVGSVASLASQYIKLADSMTGMQSKLKLVTSSTQELATAQEELFKIAQKTRQGYAETVDTFSNFAVAMGDMGKSQKEILRVTETVNKAIAISGGTAQQAAAATMQLGQAFASGTLRGDELNSILENSKGLAQAIADGMGVPIGKLRQLGSDGKITADILATALERSAQSVDDKFGKVGSTVEQSMTMAQNSILKAVGEFDKLNGISATVAQTIQDFTKYLDENGDAVNDLVRYMKDAIAVGGTLYGSILAVDTIKAIRLAMGELTLAQYAFNIAARANPYVIAGTIVAGAVGFMYDQMQQSQIEFDKKVQKSIDSQSKYNEALSTTDGKARSLGASYNSLANALSNMEKQRKNATAEQSTNLDKSIKSIKAQMANIQKEASKIGGETTKKLSPLVDTTPKAKKEKKAAKTEEQKEAEKAAEKARKIDHDLAQSQLSNISKITIARQESETDVENARIQADTDNQIRKQNLIDSLKTDIEKLNDLVVSDYNFALAMFPEGIPQEWFDSVNKKFEDLNDNIKDKLDFSIKIDFDTEGQFKSVSKIAKSMQKLNDESEQYEKNLKLAEGDSEALKKVNQEHTKNQIAGYANIAGAMSEMFAQGSRDAAAFKAIESGLAVISGVTAILEQGKGDPYTAIPRMVAMAAMVASTLQQANIAFGGGGMSTSSDAFSSMVANEGTGSVFGDATAGSESIAKSLEIMGDLAKPEFRLTSQMAKSLQSIDAKIGGVTSILMRQGGFAMGEGFEGFDTGYKSKLNVNSGIAGAMNPLTLTDNLLEKIGLGAISGFGTGIVNSILGGLFGKTSVSQTMTDSGIYFADALLQNAIDEFNGSAYQTISTTVSKKSWFSKSSSTTVSTYFAGLNDEVERQFSLVLSQLYDTTIMAGDALDTASSDIESDLSDFVVSIGKISLKGKTGDQIQETLSNIFGKIADDIAMDVFPALIPFQKIGEGLFETMTRVATGMEEAEYYINRLGLSFNDVVYSDLLNKQGDVALEALRQSIINLEGTSGGVAEIINNLTGNVEDLYTTYTALDRLRFSLTAIGTTAEGLTSSMLYGAGGIEALDDATQSYIENYLSESEQVAYNTAVMSDAFSDLGLTIPTTKQGFTELLKSIDVTTEGGQDLYGRLILLSEGFSELVESSDKLKSSLFENIQNFIDKINGELASKDPIVSFGVFTNSFNAMIDAIANGSENLIDIGNTALNNAQSYLDTVTATASAGRDIAFAKAMLVNKFSGVIAQPDTTLSTINGTLNQNNAVLVSELQALKFELNSLKTMSIDQRATSENQLSTMRAILGEVAS